MFWRDGAVEAAKGLTRLLIIAIVIVPCCMVLIVWAMPSPKRSEMHRQYVQGYQQGRADAMAKQEFHPKMATASSSSDFSKEYVRGYGDGYQLINYR